VIEFKNLTKDVAIRAAAWRNANLQALRTNLPSTRASQLRFWRNLRKSPHKYWGIYSDNEAVGIAGLTNITEGDAEISLLIDPMKRIQGLGGRAVTVLLYIGFNQMKLDFIYGECYLCNTACEFWKKIIRGDNVRWSTLPDRKYWEGNWYDSIYFSIARKA
jgi:RimJ/RimL family protein N-acetyltransferase